MAQSIKFDKYIDATGVTFNGRNTLYTEKVNKYAGFTRQVTVVNSYVKLFACELPAVWKTCNILFYLNTTQTDDYSQLVNLQLHKNGPTDTVYVKSLKTLNFIGDIQSELVCVIVSQNKCEVYKKMHGSDSPTINILSVSKLQDSDEFGEITIDCDTVVSSLPSGTQTFVSNLL